MILEARFAFSDKLVQRLPRFKILKDLDTVRHAFTVVVRERFVRFVPSFRETLVVVIVGRE
jgi:hypothetical protein